MFIDKENVITYGGYHIAEVVFSGSDGGLEFSNRLLGVGDVVIRGIYSHGRIAQYEGQLPSWPRVKALIGGGNQREGPRRILETRADSFSGGVEDCSIVREVTDVGGGGSRARIGISIGG